MSQISAVSITHEHIEQVISELLAEFKAIVHVRATDVSLLLDARFPGMSLERYYELVNEVEGILYAKRVLYFMAAYGN